MSGRKLKRICTAIFLIGLANFAVFVGVASYLGGDAVNGMVEKGHYYVSSHGKDTEVSRKVYLYSRAHARSVWVTHPLAILAALVGSQIDKGRTEGRPNKSVEL